MSDKALDPYTGTFTVIRTARKEHRCTTKSGCVIKPGDRYVDSVMPPWVMVQDDPDYPAHPWGEWDRSRSHVSHAETPAVEPVMRTVPDNEHYHPEHFRPGGGLNPMADYLWLKGEF